MVMSVHPPHWGKWGQLRGAFEEDIHEKIPPDDGIVGGLIKP
jgi:hypothetical protein